MQSPLYHYEHIDEFSKVNEHNEDNITLLCGTHHDSKTRGRLTKEKIIEKNNKPYNITNGHTSKEGIFTFLKNINKAQICVATNKFNFTFSKDSNTFHFIEVSGTPLLSVKKIENEYFMNVLLCDKNNNLVLEIKENELIHSIDIYDAKYEGSHLIVKKDKNNILIDIEFKADGIINVNKAHMFYGGREIYADGKNLLVNSTSILLMSCCEFNGGRCAIGI